MNTKKNTILLCLLMFSCLFLLACPRIRTIETTGSACGSRKPRCRIIIITYRAASDSDGQIDQNGSGVFDLANPWQPDTSENSYATVKVSTSSGQIIQSNFPVMLSSGGNISSIDKDTTPYQYVFQNPSDVNNFVSQSLTSGETSDIDISVAVPVVQTDCNIPSDIYINHSRYKDLSGITYLNSFKINYSVPDSGSINACEQASITIDE